MHAERDHGGAISTANALERCAAVASYDILRRVRSILSARRTTVAGVEHLLPSDVIADPQFYYSAGYQFQNSLQYS